MLRAQRWICNLVFLLTLSGGLFSCTSFETPASEEPLPISKVYGFDFDKVWRALNISLQQYPLKIVNIERGLIETDKIKGFDIWKPPFPVGYKEDIYSYKIIAQVIKGKIRGKPATKVIVDKKIFKKKNFFAETVSLPSDGYEEKKIQYRIRRELVIDRALNRIQSSSDSADTQ